ncbi:MAG: NAD(+) synthase [Clostridiales bacterium]|nr:NAD(+) synthase [Clostridiales bacterium]
MNLGKYGMIRAAAAVPRVSVADPVRNTDDIAELIADGYDRYGIQVMVFPELSVTGYTCADLFHQKVLVSAALESLKVLLDRTSRYDMLVAVGMPVEADNQLFNCAVVFHSGEIIGVVPKTSLPNYNEFYEKRWFASSADRISDTVRLFGKEVPFGENLLFELRSLPVCVGIEICEDLWMPIPRSSYHALHGANLILNLSASNETVTKSDYRRALVKQQAARCISGYVFSSAGQGESTTDVVFNGHAMIAFNDSILEEMTYPKQSAFIYSDLDIEKLMNDRKKFNSFMSSPDNLNYRIVSFDMNCDRDVKESFTVNPHPFIPEDHKEKFVRCKEIFTMQSVGLAERMRKTGIKKAVIALSGGLDSTLALLVTAEAMRTLQLPMTNIIGITMPGFGTTSRTYQNALTLMHELGITAREIPITEACLQHFRDIGHAPDIHDVTFENVQARERFQILFDVANMESGLVIGTGDLSELALGWCTYNGDHMSHYGVNSGVPKSLVRHLVFWYAKKTDNQNAAEALLDILNTPISPELLPANDDGEIEQKTEDVIGPYTLHDFFLYHMIRNGFSPKKILKLATLAFEGKYEPETILKWLRVFYRRFLTQQFKRSCLPDGVKVGSVCLSPRGDWRMPSDASKELFMRKLDEAAAELQNGTL